MCTEFECLFTLSLVKVSLSRLMLYKSDIPFDADQVLITFLSFELLVPIFKTINVISHTQKKSGERLFLSFSPKFCTNPVNNELAVYTFSTR